MRRDLFLCAFSLSACDAAGDPTEPPRICLAEAPSFEAPAVHCAGGQPAAGYPQLNGACRFAGVDPSHLLITTTDFATGALSVFDAEQRVLRNDVALASTDALPFYFRGMVYLLHRYALDYLDVLDPCAGFASSGQHAIEIEGVTSVNPQWLAFRDDGLAFVTVLAHHTVRVLDLTRPTGASLVGTVDLSAFADPDGKPEAGIGIVCGDHLFVAAQRLDPSFTPVQPDVLIPVDMQRCAAHDTGVTLLGSWAKQARGDPSDASGRTAFLLTTGIERVDLAAGVSEWAVLPEVFAAHDLGGFNLMAFDVAADGTTFYVAATDPDFSQVRIWRTARGASEARAVLSGLNAVGTTLEIIGEVLWFGDTTFGDSGLRAFDLTVDPPALIWGPESTGLPPYSLLAIP